MKWYEGYYLLKMDQKGKVVSHDGSHSSPKGVSQAMELYGRLGFDSNGHYYKCVQLKKELDTSHTSPNDFFNDMISQGVIKLKEVKPFNSYKIKPQINQEAINTLNMLKLR